MQVNKYIEFLQWCLHPTDSISKCTSEIKLRVLLEFAKKQMIVGVYWQGIQRLDDIANKPSEEDVTLFSSPLLTDSDKKYEQGIMDIVLKYGNFGKYWRKEQQGGWHHSFETGLRSVRHLTQFFWLSPSENLLWLPKLIKHSLIKNALRK